MANQFVVQLKNEPGAMASLAEALAARGVDLRAIGGGSIGDSGHVIMTTADDDTTKAVLDANGYTYIEGESLVTEVDDKPGGMARLSRALADAGVNSIMTNQPSDLPWHGFLPFWRYSQLYPDKFICPW